ncbi:MAG: hypothetical protein M1358_00855, partial [Chloroflexi bacterium]|nr:hypothetical protein [Chloroflexota bacterium]
MVDPARLRQLNKSGANSAEIAQRFFTLLIGDGAPGYIPIWTRQDKRTQWIQATSLGKAAQIAVNLAKSSDVYFGVGIHKDDLGPKERGAADDVSAIGALWIDIDVQGAAHKSENLPPTREAAFELIREFALQPTIIIDSGHGLQAYWVFKEPWLLENDEERQEAAELSRHFQTTFIEIAQRHGYTIDNTSDLARVLRVPGTVNRKLSPVPVYVVEMDPARRYDPTEFEPLLLTADFVPSRPSGNGHKPPSAAPVPLGRAALQFVANGALIGQQRERAVAAARNYLSAGYSVEDTAAAIWRGFQVCSQDPDREPWKYDDALFIAQDLANRPAPPLRPLNGAANNGRESSTPTRLGAKIPKDHAEAIKESATNCLDPDLRKRILATLLRKGRPPLIKRRDAGAMILKYLDEHGGFVRSEADDQFYFHNDQRRLYPLESNRFAAFLYALSGANPAGTDYAYLFADCKAAAMDGALRQIVKLAAWDAQQKVLRVSRFDGTVYRLDGLQIAEEANGENVLFDDNPLWQPYQPDYGQPGVLKWSTDELANWADETKHYGLALRAWFLALFLTELSPTRPLLVVIGEKGSGKSMLLRVLL